MRFLKHYLIGCGLLVAGAWAAVSVPLGDKTAYGHLVGWSGGEVESVLARLRELDASFGTGDEAKPAEPEKKKAAPTPAKPSKPEHEQNVAHLSKVAQLTQKPAAAEPQRSARPRVDEGLSAADEEKLDALIEARLGL